MEVIADIPGVGQNLQDHLGVFGLTWTVSQGSLPLLGTSLSADAVKNYVKARGGESSFSADVNDWFVLKYGETEGVEKGLFTLPEACVCLFVNMFVYLIISFS